MCNNETQFEVKIKFRGDDVFDIYADDKWVVSRGHIDNVLDELRVILTDMQNEVEGRQLCMKDKKDLFYTILAAITVIAGFGLLILQLVLIPLKAFGVLACSWWLVLMPLWIILTGILIFSLLLVVFILKYGKDFSDIDIGGLY